MAFLYIHEARTDVTQIRCAGYSIAMGSKIRSGIAVTKDDMDCDAGLACRYWLCRYVMTTLSMVVLIKC